MNSSMIESEGPRRSILRKPLAFWRRQAQEFHDILDGPQMPEVPPARRYTYSVSGTVNLVSFVRTVLRTGGSR